MTCTEFRQCGCSNFLLNLIEGLLLHLEVYINLTIKWGFYKGEVMFSENKNQSVNSLLSDITAHRKSGFIAELLKQKPKRFLERRLSILLGSIHLR